jgi:saccharopine dehydrogenase-like protein
VLGGAGIFGSRICRRLARHHGVRIIAAGRSRGALAALGAELGWRIETLAIDAPRQLADGLTSTGAQLVIHTAGPFQGQDYAVAELCIEHGVHYIDIADGRDFVAGFARLDAAARSAGVLAVSGASSVPGLSAAAIEAGRGDFQRLDAVEIGISPGSRAPRGPAVIAAVLGYCGRPIERWENGAWRPVHGWHDLRRRQIVGLGRRWFSACDVPDLVLLPKHYPTLRTVSFHAGIELAVLHLGLWLVCWLPRLKLVSGLAGMAGMAGAISNATRRFGSDRGGMFVTVSGLGPDGQSLRRQWSLVAGAGDGPFVPATPAVLLASKLARGALDRRGAFPCLDLFTLDEFRAEIADLDIADQTQTLPP